MEFNLWGTADEAKPLSRGVRTLLTKGFGVDKPLPRIPEGDVAVTESRLTPDDLAALADIVGADRVTTDFTQKLRRARGKSYPDLIG